MTSGQRRNIIKYFFVLAAICIFFVIAYQILLVFDWSYPHVSREEAEERTVWGTMGSFLSRPAVAIAGLCLILLFNGALLLNQPGESSSAIAVQNEQVLSDSESFIASSSSFDFENLVQP